MVTTIPATISALTDTSGNARITDVSPGTYEVNINKEGYPGVSRTLALASEEKSLEFIYYPKVTILFEDDLGRPLSGAVISTEPPTQEQICDAEGKVVFYNMPEMRYQFRIQYHETAETVRTADILPELGFTIETGRPLINILAPQSGAQIPGTAGIVFKGEGSDAEDGVLTGESLVWRSDRNGLLGYGPEITVNALDLGAHVITLEGIDSDGKTGSASISIQINEYNLGSFFPVPMDEVWEYQLLVPEFYLTTETGATEYWSVQSLTARIQPGQAREVVMLYDIARGEKIAHCRYTLTDQLLTDKGSMYVTQTQELIEEFETSRPYFIMEISTDYTPRYLILKNIYDIGLEKTYSSKSDITVSWRYTYYGQSPKPFQEWKPIWTDIEVGSEKEIQTVKGPFPAFEVIARERGGFTRTWHLAKGVGIVRFTDNVFNPQSVAILKDASILRFLNQGGGTGKPAALESIRKAPTLDLQVNRKTGKNIRALAEHLGRMCPR